ncbi:MAG: hypothetical protein RL368_1353 [Pseudomonadota bacterium]|jgi:hypothetical protein
MMNHYIFSRSVISSLILLCGLVLSQRVWAPPPGFNCTTNQWIIDTIPLIMEVVSVKSAPPFTVSFKARPQTNLISQEYYWNFGDASEETWIKGNATTFHTYNRAGDYLVRAQLRTEYQDWAYASITCHNTYHGKLQFELTDAGLESSYHTVYIPSTGELYIPYVEQLGNVSTAYEVYLMQQEGFSFNLDLTRVKTVPVPNTTTMPIHASYAPNIGVVYLPYVEVFGNAQTTQNYEVYLQQKADSFIFDLDLNRVKLYE